MASIKFLDGSVFTGSVAEVKEAQEAYELSHTAKRTAPIVSKPAAPASPDMLTIDVKDGNKTVCVLNANVHAFKTGSTGYFAVTKTVIGGERYQVQTSLVKIHSKPASK
jgi:hypothetical protein